jgi:hypothetical protein
MKAYVHTKPPTRAQPRSDGSSGSETNVIILDTSNGCAKDAKRRRIRGSTGEIKSNGNALSEARSRFSFLFLHVISEGREDKLNKAYRRERSTV